MQCVRQYIFTKFIDRVDHQTAENGIKKFKEKSDRNYGWYNPSLEDIITNPVPFDAIFGSPDFGLKIGGGFNHRAKTLGHDPLLGWIFGTANIATGTMTTWDFKSYHIKTGATKNGDYRDKIEYNADTSKVFKYTKNKLFDDGVNGKIIIGASFVKEAIHLKSDINSYASLPFPIVSTISPQLAREFAEYGVDMANIRDITKQGAGAIIINVIVSMMHRLFYDNLSGISQECYEVKTRKILSYSNLIASTSNVLVVAISSYLGNEKALKNLDVGGILVTIYRLISDITFIHKIKEEFVFDKYRELIMAPDI